jgi:catechol 2,3-dioxygenase-like lactoylglutathione lyase family enzyme
MLGHLGINVPDLASAKKYYAALMPLVGFEPFLDADDEFAFRPAGGKPGTYLFFYPSAIAGDYSSGRTGLQHLAFMVRQRSLVDAVHEFASSSVISSRLVWSSNFPSVLRTTSAGALRRGGRTRSCMA